MRATAALTLLALSIAVTGALFADLSLVARVVMAGIAVVLIAALGCWLAVVRAEQVRDAERAVRRARLVHAARQRAATQDGDRR